MVWYTTNSLVVVRQKLTHQQGFERQTRWKPVPVNRERKRGKQVNISKGCKQAQKQPPSFGVLGYRLCLGTDLWIQPLHRADWFWSGIMKQPQADSWLGNQHLGQDWPRRSKTRPCWSNTNQEFVISLPISLLKFSCYMIKFVTRLPYLKTDKPKPSTGQLTYCTQHVTTSRSV